MVYSVEWKSKNSWFNLHSQLDHDFFSKTSQFEKQEGEEILTKGSGEEVSIPHLLDVKYNTIISTNIEIYFKNI